MRTIALILSLLVGTIGYSQIHTEYVSEPTDSMALISKEDVDLINRVFNERDFLDSLCKIDEKMILHLRQETGILDSVIMNQKAVIQNHKLIIEDLENHNAQSVARYEKTLKKEKNKTISFQTLTGAGIIVIILLILL